MSRTESSKIDRIQGLPMFDSVGKRALTRLAQAAEEVDLQPGYVIITEGRKNSEFIVIESGTASVSVGGEIVAEVIEGQALGELSFFDPGPATATVTAKTAMSVLIIPHNRFQSVIDDTPEILVSVVADLAGRLRGMDARLRYKP